jgi:hypothetical protein
MAVLMKIGVFVTVTRLIDPFTQHNIPEDLSFHILYRVFSQTVCRQNQSLLPAVLQFSQQQNILYCYQ